MALALPILAAGCGGENDTSSADQGRQGGPTQAKVMTMARRDIELDKSYPAKLRSNRQAVLIARVKGLLEKRHFEEGQQVAKGDSLYTIEPDVYQAVVDERKADLQSARAKAYQAERDSARARRLAKNNAISQQEAEQTIAQQRVADAAVAQAKAALESARIDLGYTDVTAPVSGQISLSAVNLGNVVEAGTELATITPLNPLEVRFQLPQADGFDLRRQRQRQQTPITAVLQFPALAGDAATLAGRLDFLGSRVDKDTSTIAAQAVFDNPDNLYLPGQFVRVSVEGMKRFDVLAVPEIAVTQGLLGPQVYTLTQDNKVATTNVILGEEAGPRIIISNGLKPGDRVIVSDPGALEAGMTIKPQPYDGDAAALSAQADKDQKNQNKEQSSGQKQTKGKKGASDKGANE